ncbi:MAG TPA: GNAT family N-acetyltransferase [Steroidobacteraceae bacterium]|nr:GNAT family N-acetyltransferase [Steroidobacteraceae bacterium]
MQTPLKTARLEILPKTRDDTLAFIHGLPPEMKQAVSPAYLAMLESSAPVDPWIHGFTVTLDGTAIGACSFKGPPDAQGMVEIAYAIDPEYQNRGFATEAAAALARHALDSGDVRVVRAHTLPEANASTHVLEKCGFQFFGEVVDPEDGRIWRWELREV